MGSYLRKAMRSVLCYGSREVDGEHLGIRPLRRKTGVEGDAEGVVRMGGVPNRINAGKEVGRDGRRGGKLKGSECNRARNSVRRVEGKMVVSSRFKGGWEQEGDGRREGRGSCMQNSRRHQRDRV
jgi:hypothetical protein